MTSSRRTDGDRERTASHDGTVEPDETGEDGETSVSGAPATRGGSLLAVLAAAWPADVDVDAELRRSLAYLEWSVDGETVRGACWTGGSGLALVGALGALLAPGPWTLPVAWMAVATAAAVVAVGPRVPAFVARTRRTRALGAAPALLVRATLGMELSAAPERAARFATRRSDGPLARSLAGHLRRTDGGPRSGLASFGDEWRRWFPALERACSLVETAAGEGPDRRSETLDRARRLVREATRDRLADFAASVRGPTTALYAFGVMLPLALVSLLPALGATGVPVSTPAVVVLYDVLLPLGLIVASAWLLGRRPVAFPPAPVDRTHPDVPDARWPPLLAGVAAATVAGVVAVTLLPDWTPPVAATGAGAGVGLVANYRHARRVRAGVEDVESGLSDAMTAIGARVERGESVEASLAAVADDVPGPVGDVLAEAARRQRALGVGVETAFVGSRGPLATLPSRRARNCASLLELAAGEGPPAGSAVVAMGEHLDELATLEEEARRSVERVTRTLANTAAVFGPLVGGTTVALAASMGSAEGLAASQSVGSLGLAVGGYVLLLAAVLTVLATGLSRGVDRSLVGYRTGLALLAATATYLTAAVGTRLVV